MRHDGGGAIAARWGARVALGLAAALQVACGGSNFSDDFGDGGSADATSGAPGTEGGGDAASTGDAAGSGPDAASVAADAEADSGLGGGLDGAVVPDAGADAALQDGGAPDAEAHDASGPDASDAGSIYDAGGEDAAVHDAGGEDAAVHDAGGGKGDAGLFACGTTTCNPATEYCKISTGGVITPGDAGGTYSCETLPACDATDPCSCITQSASVLDTCTCSDSAGQVTESCSCNACASTM